MTLGMNPYGVGRNSTGKVRRMIEVSQVCSCCGPEFVWKGWAATSPIGPPRCQPCASHDLGDPAQSRASQRGRRTGKPRT